MRIAVLALAMGLAACGDGADRDTGDAAPVAPTPTATAAPALAELSETDLTDATLSGELACSFRRDADAAPIWFGRGNVMDDAGAEAVVKLAGAVRTLSMDGTGGYDAMADGARFFDGGIALTIARTSEEPLAEDPQIAMESPLHPATITLAIPGEDERTIDGFFECGP